MQEVNCIICGQNKTKHVTENNGFNLVKCLNDGLVYVNPQPDENDFKKFYEANEYFFKKAENDLGYSDYFTDRPAIIKNTAEIIKEIRKFCPKGRFLDIGCAFGFALDLAREAGFEVYGNDLNPAAVKYAKEVLRLENAKVGYAGELGCENASFDVVTMLGTIEHFQNPQNEIGEAKRLLKPGGILAVFTVDFDSLIGRGTIRPPEHLYYFSEKTMRKFLEKNNFEIVKITPRFLPNRTYFVVEDFFGRLFHYFYRLTSSASVKKLLIGLRKTSLFTIKKIGLSGKVIPALDGQFLTIARRRSA